MGNLPQEQEITHNVTDVEIRKIDENNVPNPQKFYINKDLSNKLKISEIISQFFSINKEDITKFENHNSFEFTFKQNSIVNNEIIKNDSSNTKNLNNNQDETKEENVIKYPTYNKNFLITKNENENELNSINETNINSPENKKENPKKKTPT